MALDTIYQQNPQSSKSAANASFHKPAMDYSFENKNTKFVKSNDKNSMEDDSPIGIAKKKYAVIDSDEETVDQVCV